LCERCGKEFISHKSKNQQFCSYSCKNTKTFDKKILQIDLDGTIINSFDNYTDISKALNNENLDSVRKQIWASLAGKKEISYGFKWRYVDD